jgi:hypothetical protein
VKRLLTTATLILLTLASTSAAHAAGPPVITSTSASGVGEATATLEGTLDPNGTRAKAHFEYLTQAEYLNAGEAFTGATSTKDITLENEFSAKGDAEAGSSTLKGVSAEKGALATGQTIKATGVLPAGTTIFLLRPDPSAPGKLELVLSAAALKTEPGAGFKISGIQPVSAPIEGLIPQTQYRFRLLASHTGENPPAAGPTTTLYTLAPVPTFEDCPANEPFRSGTFAPFGHPSDALPDCRAFEQASPVNKNGGDVLGEVQFSKAADDGSGATFGASFGVPGAEGAQERPFYLTTRGKDGWTTTGLFPPPSSGQKAWPLLGWLPDFSATYASSARTGEGFKEALFEIHRDGSPPIQITPYGRDNGGLAGAYFAGASADASTVVVESLTKFPPTEGGTPIALAKEGSPNVYAWDRATEELHLASVMNSQAESDEQLPRGGIAGSYDWLRREIGTRLGGASRLYYLRDERAVSADGSVFFTAAGSGQLYQRLNPTAEQSNPGPNGYVEDGHCFEPAKACTIHLSASEKTNGGPSQNGPDPAGPQPAAFQAASADGSVSYFTSSEKLTNDASTGPEQPPAQIGVADLSDPDPDATKDESFLPTHAKGIATSPDGEYLYWVDPSKNSIGRAKLNPDGSHGAVEDDFILPGETEVELTPELGSPEVLKGPSVPRYVAVGPCAEGGECVYWTNSGPVAIKGLGAPYYSTPGQPVFTGGTIGRAVLDGSGDVIPDSVDADFISGASNPQGIAVNSEYIYWADTGFGKGNDVARATLDGVNINLHFLHPGFSVNPWGVALNPSHIYVSANFEVNHQGYILQFPLGGGPLEQHFFLEADGIREVAVDDSHVYWTSQFETAIGRADLDLGNPSKQFIQIQGVPDGLARDSANLYWTTNGEAPTNPGNDLYRHIRKGAGGCNNPGGCLEDLTVDASDPNGAEVKGVLGTSADGSYVYFVANGDLDGSGPAQPGTCEGPAVNATGSCNLYLWDSSSIQFVTRLRLGGGTFGDATNLLQTPVSEINSTGGYSQKTSFLSPDGKTLVFRSGTSYYRYRIGKGLACLTCSPDGEGDGNAGLQSAKVNNGQQAARSYSVQSHHLSADGNRFFFETTDALVTGDTNNTNGCPNLGNQPQFFFSCQDVYEWEAPGSGTCKEGGPAYSPANQGCLYLISTGRSKYPSFFVDASASGNDVFFLTRDQLVGQDTDQLQDVYDARVNGGLASQNQPPSISCENEGCKNEAGPTPQFSAPPQISGPGNPPIKRKHCKPKKGKKTCAKHRKHQNRNRPTTNNHGGLR